MLTQRPSYGTNTPADYKSTQTSFSARNANSTGSAIEARDRTDDYTIVMIVSKHSTANTIASSGCIANLLKFHLDASSERGRFSCRPIVSKKKDSATKYATH